MTVQRRETLKQMIGSVDQFGAVLLDMKIQYEAVDYGPVLGQHQRQLEIDHKTNFSHETAPDGSAWAKLSPATVKRKGHGRILWETGTLEASLSEPSAEGAVRAVSHRGLLFGTSVEYAGVHQHGSRDGRIVARPHTGVKSETLEKMVNDVADASVESLKLTL